MMADVMDADSGSQSDPAQEGILTSSSSSTRQDQAYAQRFANAKLDIDERAMRTDDLVERYLLASDVFRGLETGFVQDVVKEHVRGEYKSAYALLKIWARLRVYVISTYGIPMKDSKSNPKAFEELKDTIAKAKNWRMHVASFLDKAPIDELQEKGIQIRPKLNVTSTNQTELKAEQAAFDSKKKSADALEEKPSIAEMRERQRREEEQRAAQPPAETGTVAPLVPTPAAAAAGTAPGGEAPAPAANQKPREARREKLKQEEATNRARMAELEEKKKSKGSLTPEEQIELTNLQAAYPDKGAKRALDGQIASNDDEIELVQLALEDRDDDYLPSPFPDDDDEDEVGEWIPASD